MSRAAVVDQMMLARLGEFRYGLRRTGRFRPGLPVAVFGRELARVSRSWRYGRDASWGFGAGAELIAKPRVPFNGGSVDCEDLTLLGLAAFTEFSKPVKVGTCWAPNFRNARHVFGIVEDEAGKFWYWDAVAPNRFSAFSYFPCQVVLWM